LEGASYWLIRSAPLTIKEFLWAKFWSSLIPLLVVSEIMIVVSNYLLKATPFMMSLGIITVFIMTFGITSLGVGMGAMFPRFKHDNPAQIPSGFGGIVCMLVTLSFIGVVVLLEAWPVYKIFMSQNVGQKITLLIWMKIYISIFTALVVNFLAILLPIMIGTTRLMKQES
jgi:ABC-2 type transport system permease protein